MKITPETVMIILLFPLWLVAMGTFALMLMAQDIKGAPVVVVEP